MYCCRRNQQKIKKCAFFSRERIEMNWNWKYEKKKKSIATNRCLPRIVVFIMKNIKNMVDGIVYRIHNNNNNKKRRNNAKMKVDCDWWRKPVDLLLFEITRHKKKMNRKGSFPLISVTTNNEKRRRHCVNITKQQENAIQHFKCKQIDEIEE